SGPLTAFRVARRAGSIVSHLSKTAKGGAPSVVMLPARASRRARHETSYAAQRQNTPANLRTKLRGPCADTRRPITRFAYEPAGAGLAPGSRLVRKAIWPVW